MNTFSVNICAFSPNSEAYSGQNIPRPDTSCMHMFTETGAELHTGTSPASKTQ